MKEQTLAIHAGYEKDTQHTMAVPIYMSTAYDFGSADFAASSFNLEQGTDHVYTRVGNPTTAVLERRFAQLEGGSGALAISSGMGAIFYSILNVAGAGDNIILSSKLYGGTITLFTQTLKKLGIEGRFFNIDNPQEIDNLVDDNTRAIFFESISNPSIDVANIEEIVTIADKHGILTIVDNTVATPFLCKPFSFGVDVVVHSASKYTTGQGLAIGGLMVERVGLVDKIKNNSRYPYFNEPETSYHGLIFADCPASSVLFTFRTRMILLRDTGAVLSPFNAWLFIQGLETLALRMRQHSDSALKIANFLLSHSKVKKVNYPLLKNDKNYENAIKYLSKGASGLLSFEVKDFAEAKKILDGVEIFSIVANIGDSKSIINHSASTTHQQLSKAELLQAGINEGLIRLSVGLEDSDDLIEDLKIALG